MCKSLLSVLDYLYIGAALGLVIGSILAIAGIVGYLSQKRIDFLEKPSLPEALSDKFGEFSLAIPCLVELHAAKREGSEELRFIALHKRLRQRYGAPKKIENTSNTVEYLRDKQHCVETRSESAGWRGRERKFVKLNELGEEYAKLLETTFFPTVLSYLQSKYSNDAVIKFSKIGSRAEQPEGRQAKTEDRVEDRNP
jgi:hypothetical protein